MGVSDTNVTAALQGLRAVSPSTLPGTDVPIGVRALSDDEIDEARLEAVDYFDRKCRLARQDLVRFLQLDPDALDREHQRQVLARAICERPSGGGEPTPFFRDPVELRRLPAVTIGQLWELYKDHLDTVCPRDALTEERAVALVEALKKKSQTTELLAAFERDTLCSLVRILANQLAI